jgi:hypothetical protein
MICIGEVHIAGYGDPGGCAKNGVVDEEGRAYAIRVRQDETTSLQEVQFQPRQGLATQRESSLALPR